MTKIHSIKLSNENIIFSSANNFGVLKRGAAVPTPNFYPGFITHTVAFSFILVYFSIYRSTTNNYYNAQ